MPLITTSHDRLERVYPLLEFSEVSLWPNIFQETPVVSTVLSSQKGTKHFEMQRNRDGSPAPVNRCCFSNCGQNFAFSLSYDFSEVYFPILKRILFLLTIRNIVTVGPKTWRR
jgi:hypothetical protein